MTGFETADNNNGQPSAGLALEDYLRIARARWKGILAFTLALTVLANQAPPPDLSGLVDNIAPRPLLLIRGLAGQRQEALNRVYHDAARQPKALWEVPGAGHTGALSTQPQEYEQRVVGLFDRALLAHNPRP